VWIVLKHPPERNCHSKYGSITFLRSVGKTRYLAWRNNPWIVKFGVEGVRVMTLSNSFVKIVAVNGLNVSSRQRWKCAPSFVHLLVRFGEFVTGKLYKNILNDCEFSENRRSERHTSRWRVNEFLSFSRLFDFGEIRHKEYVQNAVERFWVSWKSAQGRPLNYSTCPVHRDGIVERLWNSATTSRSTFTCHLRSMRRNVAHCCRWGLEQHGVSVCLSTNLCGCLSVCVFVSAFWCRGPLAEGE